MVTYLTTGVTPPYFFSVGYNAPLPVVFAGFI
jgi:hypothetical protein